MKDLAPGFEVEAWSLPDRVPEAIRRRAERGSSYIAATQWHPEFHKFGSTDTLDDTPILQRLPVGLRHRQGEPAGRTCAARPGKIRDRAARMLRQALLRALAPQLPLAVAACR